jgi:DNA-binding response OmpR family regulator
LIPVVPPPWALLAYEDDEIKASVTAWLQKCGYCVRSGMLADGSWGAALAEVKPDLVVLEWTRAGMNGGIVVSLLKGDAALARVPVLAITDAEPALAKREILEGFEIPRLLPTVNQEGLCTCVEEVVLGLKRLDV